MINCNSLPVHFNTTSVTESAIVCRSRLGDHLQAYTQLLDCLYDAVFITDAKGRVVDMNPRAMDYFKIPTGTECGFSLLNFISGADEGLLRQIRQHLHQHRYTLLDARCLRTDSTSFPAEIAVTVTHVHAPDQFAFFVHDITDRQENLRKLAEANDRLRAHDTARMEFISNVSHELRTPLTSMIYGVQGILRGAVGDISDDLRTYVKRFESDCRRLLGTVNDILELRKIEVGALTLEKSLAPLSRIAAEAVEIVRIQSDQKGQTLTLKTKDAGTFCVCDVPKIERVLINILGNAIKFTPKGGKIDLTVEGVQEFRSSGVQEPASNSPPAEGCPIQRNETIPPPSRRDGSLGSSGVVPSSVVITCDDTGIGIPADAIAHVTERYYRVGEHIAGTGLGLSISREIITLHGGKIDLQSPVPGTACGTSVRVTLPAAPAPLILVVDDDPLILELLADEVRLEGYRVITAATAAEMMSLITQHSVGMILLDLHLPDMEGSQSVLQLRTRPEYARLPILAITGTEPQSAIAETLHRFSVPVLTKPWKADEVASRIANAFFAPKL